MSTSEINQILVNSLSPDANLRQPAEQQLQQAAESNFPLYLLTLVGELANESTDGYIRSAAGLALKNAISTRDTSFTGRADLHAKWLQQTDDETKSRVKSLTIQTLGSSDAKAGNAAAQVISNIAAVELPRAQWPELMGTLVRNVSEGSDHLKQASLTTIGYICESSDPELRLSLGSHSNAILTAVVQGARKEEANIAIRLAAMTALADSLEFVEENFKNEGERNYIMQVVCEATQADDPRVKRVAFGCLNRVMSLYYESMRFYMEKALFGLTILGMRSTDEDVAKLAVEFWSSVCEEEIRIEEENSQVDTSDLMLPFFNFARIAAGEVVPVLLSLLMKQEEDAPDDEYNISRAAYQSLQLYAQAVGATIITPVLQFVEENLRSENWHNRDAAVSAFGAIMDGPECKVLEPIVKQALPVLIDMLRDDPNLHVKDSTAYALGRITEYCSGAIEPQQHLDPLMQSLFAGLLSNNRMAFSSCWTLLNVAERFGSDSSNQQNPLTPHFNQSVTNLLEVTKRPECESATRSAAYEVLNVFVRHAAIDSMHAIGELSTVILGRLEETIPLQAQVVSVEDKITLEEIMSSLCSVLQEIIQKLGPEIASQGDRIMATLLHILTSFGGKSSVPEAIFACISALATAMEQDFVKYLNAFNPFLLNALGNQEEPGLCSVAIGLVSDITRSTGEMSQPYCDDFMNYLLENLRSTTLSNQFKPAILQCFGDIASAIGGHFETYLSIVAQVLQQAASFSPTADSPLEMYDYVVSLREGIMDAWGGIIGAMHSSGKTNVLENYIPQIWQLLNAIATDTNRNEPLMRAAMGVIGDLADAYPGGQLVEGFRQDWLMNLIRETRSNREYHLRTIETARWAREQVRRQIGAQTAIMQQS